MSQAVRTTMTQKRQITYWVERWRGIRHPNAMQNAQSAEFILTFGTTWAENPTFWSSLAGKFGGLSWKIPVLRKQLHIRESCSLASHSYPGLLLL